MPEMNTSYSYAISKELENQQQQTDPKALATLIQKQLEVINDEIKMIQVCEHLQWYLFKTRRFLLCSLQKVGLVLFNFTI